MLSNCNIFILSIFYYFVKLATNKLIAIYNKELSKLPAMVKRVENCNCEDKNKNLGWRNGLLHSIKIIVERLKTENEGKYFMSSKLVRFFFKRENLC